jgi:preprotein translocase subunit SecB
MGNPSVQHAIRLLNVKVVSVDFSTDNLFDRNISDELEANVEYAVRFNDDEPKMYIVEFKVQMKDKEKDINFSLKAIALFESENEIDDDFKNSSFANQNSPAIAFPFVRSFISTFTTNAGLEPIILPSFNFASQNQKNDN